MRKQEFNINHIPALLWGEPAEKLMIAVHGDQSNKSDTIISLLAEVATPAGYQVLSFDLPEHGDRGGEPLCKVQTCVEELRMVMEYARSICDNISLFGCSLGAYFGLVAYEDEALEQCLFLSPVVDMERLIHNMMQWAKVSEEKLKEEENIRTSFGKTLYWDYYCYVKEHPVIQWNIPTAILYGEKDTLSEYERVSRFAKHFQCDLTLMQDGEHFFHTPAQLNFFRCWLNRKISAQK